MAEKAKIAFGFNLSEKPFGELVIDLQERTNMLLSKNWKRALQNFLRIPPGRNHSRRMGQTTVKENQFDFGIIKLPHAIGNRDFKSIHDSKFGHWAIKGSRTTLDSNSVKVVEGAKTNPNRPFVHVSGYSSQPGNGLRSVLEHRCIDSVWTDQNSLIIYQGMPVFVKNGETMAADSSGMSGGPIFINENHLRPLTRDPITWRLLGIHGHAGHGVLFTHNVIDEIERMKRMLR